jgi:hypothetical protein
MADPTPHPHSTGKSKTALRRGEFTVGHPAGSKTGDRLPQATTPAEQTFLFDLPPMPRPAEHKRRGA